MNIEKEKLQKRESKENMVTGEKVKNEIFFSKESLMC